MHVSSTLIIIIHTLWSKISSMLRLPLRLKYEIIDYLSCCHLLSRKFLLIYEPRYAFYASVISGDTTFFIKCLREKWGLTDYRKAMKFAVISKNKSFMELLVDKCRLNDDCSLLTICFAKGFYEGYVFLKKYVSECHERLCFNGILQNFVDIGFYIKYFEYHDDFFEIFYQFIGKNVCPSILLNIVKKFIANNVFNMDKNIALTIMYKFNDEFDELLKFYNKDRDGNLKISFAATVTMDNIDILKKLLDKCEIVHEFELPQLSNTTDENYLQQYYADGYGAHINASNVKSRLHNHVISSDDCDILIMSTILAIHNFGKYIDGVKKEKCLIYLIDNFCHTIYEPYIFVDLFYCSDTNFILRTIDKIVVLNRVWIFAFERSLLKVIEIKCNLKIKSKIILKIISKIDFTYIDKLIDIMNKICQKTWSSRKGKEVDKKPFINIKKYLIRSKVKGRFVDKFAFY